MFRALIYPFIPMPMIFRRWPLFYVKYAMWYGSYRRSVKAWHAGRLRSMEHELRELPGLREKALHHGVALDSGDYPTREDIAGA